MSPTEAALQDAHGAVVATLVRRLGTGLVQIAEDAAQDAAVAALEAWPTRGLPDNPVGWLIQVAWRKALDERRTARRRAGLRAHAALRSGATPPALPPPGRLSAELDDDRLRMLFACCDPALPEAAQLALALKTLCGLTVPAIARLQFVSEAALYKRLARARARLRAAPPDLERLAGPALAPRVRAVERVLYLMFTEGHLSADPAYSVRPRLCAEALRLGGVLTRHPLGDRPTTAALMALMHLHAARLPGRRDPFGALVLLGDQDRGRWDGAGIADGLAWLARSARGEAYSRYHAEAGIAAEHCLAGDLASTRWDRVAFGYAQLERLAPSPLHTLNRALAVAEWRGAAQGLAVLDAAVPPTWLAGSYLWSAALADLADRAGQPGRAARHQALALEDAPTPAIRDALSRRWGL